MDQKWLDCQQIPSNVTYNCSNPWPTCKSLKRFDFNILWNYTNQTWSACANDSRLYRPIKGLLLTNDSIALTQEACVAAAGAGWKRYPRSDIWTRLTTWKFPLLQLAFIFPRPPIDAAVETFVVFHLLGDPINSIANLLHKLSTCQYWATCWQDAGLLEGTEPERDWKALTLITDAYAEWEHDLEVYRVLEQALSSPSTRESLQVEIYQTANALAADRATKSLPVFAAQIFFIITIGVSILRTADVASNGSSALNNTVYVNVETFSIAFSALYFWIIPTVIFGSVIGVSQTEAAIPRILKRFQDDIEHHETLKNLVQLPNESPEDKNQRKFRGGIYTWQPPKSKSQVRSSLQRQSRPRSKSQSNGTAPPSDQERTLPNAATQNTSASLHNRPNICHWVLAQLVVISGAATGLIISSLVPPGSFNCRHVGELSIVVGWFASAYLNIAFDNYFPLAGEPRTLLSRTYESRDILFFVTFLKDVVFTVSTMLGIALTQWGILNRCECFTNWGRVGLALPQMHSNDNLLRERIKSTYIIITVISLAIHVIVFPWYIYWRYSSALRVYVQRDDKHSNTPEWVEAVVTWCSSLIQKIGRYKVAKHQPAGRTNTTTLEIGSVGLRPPKPNHHRASSSQSPLLPSASSSEQGEDQH